MSEALQKAREAYDRATLDAHYVINRQNGMSQVAALGKAGLAFTALVSAAREGLSHVCGLQGFQRGRAGLDDTCPACTPAPTGETGGTSPKKAFCKRGKNQCDSETGECYVIGFCPLDDSEAADDATLLRIEQADPSPDRGPNV